MRLNFSRSLETRNEDMAWVSRNRRWDPSSVGLMTGLAGLDQGIGLDVVPSASFTNRRVLRNDIPGTPTVEPELDTSEDDFERSLDLFYKLTPQMNASLTFNTGFSAIEVDDRQVNLTRFGLFFPESATSSCARPTSSSSVASARQMGPAASATPSGRTRGRSSRGASGLGQFGEPVDLNYGGKISGRTGRFELGALSIRQDENALAGVDDTTLSVVRAKAGIGAESTVGAVFTNGDPLNPRDNSLAGVDALYRNSRLPGGRTIEAGAWYQETETELLPNELWLAGGSSAAGIGISVPSNDKFRGAFSTRRVEQNFYPALGFTSRTNVQDYAGQIAYTHRPATGYWQSLFFNLDGQRIEGLNGRLQSQQIGLTPIQMHNRTNDMLGASAVLGPYRAHGRRISQRQSRPDVRQLHLDAVAAFPHGRRFQHPGDRPARRERAVHDAHREYELRRRVLVEAVMDELDPIASTRWRATSSRRRATRSGSSRPRKVRSLPAFRARRASRVPVMIAAYRTA